MKQVLQVFREASQGFATLLCLAPAIALLAFAGEMLQHIAEVQLGMFASKQAFAAQQMSPIRLGFGVVKIAAVLLAATWAARWLALRAGWAGPLDWSRLALPGLVIVAAQMAVLFSPLAGRSRLAALTAVALASLPLLQMALDAMFGAPRLSWRDSLKIRPQPPLAELVVLLPIALLVYLHFTNHHLASGAAPALVWALMIWDAALIALLALWLGILLSRTYQPLPAA